MTRNDTTGHSQPGKRTMLQSFGPLSVKTLVMSQLAPLLRAHEILHCPATCAMTQEAEGGPGSCFQECMPPRTHRLEKDPCNLPALIPRLCQQHTHPNIRDRSTIPAPTQPKEAPVFAHKFIRKDKGTKRPSVGTLLSRENPACRPPAAAWLHCWNKSSLCDIRQQVQELPSSLWPPFKTTSTSKGSQDNNKANGHISKGESQLPGPGLPSVCS